MNSGIYLIRNTMNGLVYVGQSFNINSRISCHKNLLKKNKHCNDYLQKHYNKYGKESFVFEPIERCPKSKLDEREVYWIAHYNSLKRSHGYNLESGGNVNKVVSEETRQKKMGANNPRYGKSHTKEFVEYMRIVNRATSDKLTEQDVEQIKLAYLAGVDQKELAVKDEVEFCTINKIIKCKNWNWVRTDLENELIGYADRQREIFNERAVLLYQNGQTLASITKELKSDHRRVKKVLVDAGVYEEPPDLEARNQRIVDDFNGGLPKPEIMKKYGISQTHYTRITSEAFNKKRQDKIRMAHELKAKGMLNKDIATELGINKCTVKEYLNQANTEVSENITRHCNA